MKIIKGDKFECIQNVEMEGGGIAYIKGKIYTSDRHGAITDDEGYDNHYWNEMEAEMYFKLVTPDFALLEEYLKETRGSYMKNKQEVIQWGADKGILTKATPMSQAIKTLSEVEELLRAINCNDREEIKDAYGDILVTIILGAELSGFDIEDCLQSAYDVIKNRQGSMINGTFVKNS